MVLEELAERDELIARLSSSIAGGEPPDLFLLNYRYFGQFAARDALEPLDARTRELRRLHERRLLPRGDGGVRVRRATAVHAAEHLQFGRLLQRDPVPTGEDRRAPRGLVLGRDGRRRLQADGRQGRRRDARAVRARRRSRGDPDRALRLVQRRTDRRRRGRSHHVHVVERRGRAGDAAVLRSARDLRHRADGGGAGVGGQRVAVPRTGGPRC